MKAEEYIKSSAVSSKIFCESCQNGKLIFREDAETAVRIAQREIRDEYEQVYKHVEETLEAIVNDCARLTPGNVSHNAAGIQGAAQRRLDYIRKHKDGNT